ncbi:hypothetical protein D3C71_1696700 [compost metagenome]
MNAEFINTWPPCTANGTDTAPPAMVLTMAKRSALTRNWLCNPAAVFSMPSPIPAAMYCPVEVLYCIFTDQVAASLPFTSLMIEALVSIIVFCLPISTP